ncbi:helix-turn-helix domain-containing protein [Fulvivirgaceae bacterium BMA10]|uniref:Helix-turn-helix domain-containing protein n=1 Tax=Splendidivirga corallicola TaxID=3051826 RepID=A0ABT8KVN9_9BACT|nr:helix-turn-helix domain-containing protein [Fulvivirgaceae bacterium BMA10]
MKSVSVLLLNDCTTIAPIGALELLKKSGVIHQQLTGEDKPFFHVELVSSLGTTVQTQDGYAIHCERSIENLDKTDVLLLPALEFDVKEKIEVNKHCVEHIRRLHQQGTEIATMCTGAFLLAATGLLNQKKATTHWFLTKTFQQMFPEVELMDDKIIVDNGKLYTCGGATSFINLVLYLVEKYCGKETAIMTSKMLLIDFNKPPQNHYAMFTPQMQHDDKIIMETQEYLQSHNKFITVGQLAERANMSHSTFLRRFKKATGESPLKYIQRMQVEKIKDMLETTDKRFDEIAYGLGYNDIPSLRKVFKHFTGLSPLQYKDRYKR